MGNRWFGFAIVTSYLVGFGVLTGTLIERIRFDESRSVLLKQLDEDRSKLHGGLWRSSAEQLLSARESVTTFQLTSRIAG